MDEYGPSTYGDRIAEAYDSIYPEVPFSGPAATTVEFLRPLAGDGPALELGIGTGRIAIPLAAAGVPVRGLDASTAMVERMRTKPGGDEIDVTIGDFRDFDLGERFPLVYVVFNTFFGLLTSDDQVRCLRAVRRHLTADGAFVMEAFVPDMSRFDRGQRVSAIRVEPDEVALEVTKVDIVEQRSDSQQVLIREDGIRLYPVRIRFAFVAELDLMAHHAGLRLRKRFADWDRTPFTSSSPKHVSIWEPDREADD